MLGSKNCYSLYTCDLRESSFPGEQSWMYEGGGSGAGVVVAVRVPLPLPLQLERLVLHIRWLLVRWGRIAVGSVAFEE